MDTPTAAERRQLLAGLRFRPYAGEPDLAEILRIENAEAEADALPERNNLDSLAVRYTHPSEHFDPRRDVTIAELDGATVAGASPPRPQQGAQTPCTRCTGYTMAPARPTE